MRKRSRHLRREFLLESNQTHRHVSRKFRNRFLNVLARILLIRQIMKLFRASFMVGIILAIMALFILFAVVSPYFHLKKISIIRDNPNLDSEQIEKTLGEFYGKNLLFLFDGDVREVLFNAFPEFRQIEISEHWPDEIELHIMVSPPKFNVLNTETANFSVISEDGVVLQSEPDENLPTIKILQYEKPIQVRDRLLSKEDIEKIIQAERILQEEIGLPLNATDLLWTARELHLISKQDMEIWIDLTLPIEEQMQKLELARQEMKLDTQAFDHIDLRIPKQIFWKWRE